MKFKPLNFSYADFKCGKKEKLPNFEFWTVYDYVHRPFDTEWSVSFLICVFHMTACRILIRKPLGKFPLARESWRWEDNIKVDLGGEDRRWILIHDLVQ
jgi:hypothetical protein